MEEILHHLENNGMNCQPQVVSRIYSINSTLIMSSLPVIPAQVKYLLVGFVGLHTSNWKVFGSLDHMDVFPKIVGKLPPNHPLKNRVFHYKPSILGTTIFGNTYI